MYSVRRQRDRGPAVARRTRTSIWFFLAALRWRYWTGSLTSGMTVFRAAVADYLMKRRCTCGGRNRACPFCRGSGFAPGAAASQTCPHCGSTTFDLPTHGCSARLPKKVPAPIHPQLQGMTNGRTRIRLKARPPDEVARVVGITRTVSSATALEWFRASLHSSVPSYLIETVTQRADGRYMTKADARLGGHGTPSTVGVPEYGTTSPPQNEKPK